LFDCLLKFIFSLTTKYPVSSSLPKDVIYVCVENRKDDNTKEKGTGSVSAKTSAKKYRIKKAPGQLTRLEKNCSSLQQTIAV
jgi:hypothetical protein